MGGRVAFEVGFRNSDRVDRIVGLTPSLAWSATGRDPLVKVLRPELGLIQITPRRCSSRPCAASCRAGATGGPVFGVDEFLRAYMQPRGRAGSTRRCATSTSTSRRATRASDPLRALEHESLFVWGAGRLVPIAFARHVREALPGRSTWSSNADGPARAPRETHAAVAVSRG